VCFEIANRATRPRGRSHPLELQLQRLAKGQLLCGGEQRRSHRGGARARHRSQFGVQSGLALRRDSPLAEQPIRVLDRAVQAVDDLGQGRGVDALLAHDAVRDEHCGRRPKGHVLERIATEVAARVLRFDALWKHSSLLRRHAVTRETIRHVHTIGATHARHRVGRGLKEPSKASKCFDAVCFGRTNTCEIEDRLHRATEYSTDACR